MTVVTPTADAIPWSQLREAAERARNHAHAPYSNYRVGAALLDTHGDVHVGCNVENASYGLCLCAERSAVAAAISCGVRTFQAVLILTGGEEPGTPCGMCRQVLAEFPPDFAVRCETVDGNASIETTVSALLPAAFDASQLES